MPVTLKELAEIVGLEKSTVAYALSGKGTISSKTRAKILTKAAEVGYMPNRSAKRLRSKQTKMIGLVIPDVLGSYNELVQETFRRLSAHGYDVEIALTEFKPELEDRAVRTLLESRVDGIILKTLYADWADVPEDSSLHQIEATGTAAVCLDYAPEGSDLPCFRIPARQIGRMITEHLLSLGHRRIAWLLPSHAPLDTYSYRDRVAGSGDALRAAGVDLANLTAYKLAADDSASETFSESVGENSRDYLSESLPRMGIRRGQALFREAMTGDHPRPTAVICYNDVVAVGAMIEAQQMGLRVPEDVAIAGNSHTLAAELAPLSLTTVYMPVPEMVRSTLDLLFQSIGGRREWKQPAPVQPHLAIRRSTVGTQDVAASSAVVHARRAALPASLWQSDASAGGDE